MAAFSDDFNRPDSTDLGPGWVEVSGDWSIISNQLAPDTSSGSTILRAATTMASNDHSAQFTIAATTTASQGVWCRGNTNLTSGYLWRTNGSSWDLFSVVSGTFTMIGTYAVAVVPGDVARVQAVGSTIKGFVNGVERVSVVNTDVASGTNVGLRVMAVAGLRFDNFAAADVTAGATLNPAAATETAQPLTGAKTATLDPAADAHVAQPVAGEKAMVLGAAAALESAQALTCNKTAPLGRATATEAAQGLAGAKTGALSPAIETSSVQTIDGAKTAVLPASAEADTALPLGGAKSRSFSAADSAEAARSLTGTRRGTLSPAVETSTARPLAAAGADVDVDVTVGAPYSPWTARPPHASSWKVGAPC